MTFGEIVAEAEQERHAGGMPQPAKGGGCGEGAALLYGAVSEGHIGAVGAG